MALDRHSLYDFVQMLPSLLDADETKIQKINLPGRQETNWDSPAREVMKQKFCTWLKDHLDLSEVAIERTLFVEGLFGNLPSGVQGEFFGSVCCPDLALTSSDGYSVAVELDHGSTGSRLRDAITKASFNVLVGGFDVSMVLFFVELKDRRLRETRFDPNHTVLRMFEDCFSTSVLFVTNYEPSP